MSIHSRSALLAAGLLGLAMTGCTDSRAYETSMCALVDVSGTYADELGSVVKIIKGGLLPDMLPGDSLFLIAIDSDSYDEENLKASLTLDRRPSRANAQKLNFAAELERFSAQVNPAKFTDISGAMMLCSDYLKASAAGTELMFVFSDMKEELPSGVERQFAADEFSGIEVVAMNVIKLKGDNIQPAVYRERVQIWKDRVGAAGADDWHLVVDPSTISQFLHRQR